MQLILSQLHDAHLTCGFNSPLKALEGKVKREHPAKSTNLLSNISARKSQKVKKERAQLLEDSKLLCLRAWLVLGI